MSRAGIGAKLGQSKFVVNNKTLSSHLCVTNLTLQPRFQGTVIGCAYACEWVPLQGLLELAKDVLRGLAEFVQTVDPVRTEKTRRENVTYVRNVGVRRPTSPRVNRGSVLPVALR